MWADWWLWVAAGILLAGAEVLAPGYVFLGFSLGAVATGTVLGLGGPFAAHVAADVARVLVLFAVASAVGWGVLRAVAGVRNDQVRSVERDVNDD